MFNYDEKFQARINIDTRIAREHPEHVQEMRARVLQKAFASVAEKSLSEHGVNIKTVIHEFESFEHAPYSELVIGAVVLLSFPKERVMKFNELPLNFFDDYICIWCGAKNPMDDKYHSGTCENCGGPKV